MLRFRKQDVDLMSRSWRSSTAGTVIKAGTISIVIVELAIICNPVGLTTTPMIKAGMRSVYSTFYSVFVLRGEAESLLSRRVVPTLYCFLLQDSRLGV